jgi:glutamate carboxypeptidase
MITLQDFKSQTESILDLLTCLVEIETPSTDKAAVDRLGEWLAAELRRLGARVDIDQQEKAGNNLVARWSPNPEKTGILALCHMDTVYAVGTLAQHPLRIERLGQEGRFYAPGGLDMKGGIACFLTAIRRLQELGQMPNRPITALFTSDEEIGSTHSRALIERTAVQAELALCLEPALPDGSLKTARKGTGELVIETLGKAAHAGVDHARGRNAIEELAHHILAVQALTDYTTGTTLSVGKVEGGTRTNVVPDWARAVVDLRVPTAAEAGRIRLWAASVRPHLEGTSVTVVVHQDRPPMPRDALMADTFHKVQAIGTRLGLQFGEGSTGGGSDANYVAPLGIPVMDGLGPVGEGAHSEREVVFIESLPERAALLAALLTEI